MTPALVLAWVQVAQTLIGVGVNVVSSLRAMIGAAHPSLTPDQLNAAYVAILTDDGLRQTWAEKASQPSTSPG